MKYELSKKKLVFVISALLIILFLMSSYIKMWGNYNAIIKERDDAIKERNFALDDVETLTTNIQSLRSEYEVLKSEYDILYDSSSNSSPYSNDTNGENISEKSSNDLSEENELDKGSKVSEGSVLEHVTYNSYKTVNNLIFILSNESEYTFQKLNINVIFYDSNKKMLSVDDSYVVDFKPGQSSIAIIDLPLDSEYNNIDFKTYEVTLEEDSWIFSHVNLYDKVSFESNKGSQNIITKFTNNSEFEINELDTYILYYKDNKIIGYDFNSSNKSLKPNNSLVIEYERPEAKQYYSSSLYSSKYLDFDDYKIFINNASMVD